MVSSTMVDEMIRKCLLSAVTNVSLSEPGGGQCNRMASGMIPPNVFPIIPRTMVPDTIDGTGNLVTVPTHEKMKRINQPTSVHI